MRGVLVAAAIVLFLAPGLGAATPSVVRLTNDVVVVGTAGGEIEVRTTTSDAAVVRTRTASVSSTHVEISDTIVNPSDAIVGLRVRHAVAVTGGHAWLGGRSEPSLERLYDPWNPTVFVPTFAGGGVGLVAEDDVFRNQLTVDRDDATHTAGLATDLLCLAPGATHTMTWSVYPTATADYWDFVNVLRHDWHANDVTIPGAMIWFRPDDVLARPVESLRAALTAQNVAVASLSGGWVDPQRTDAPPRIGFGTYVMDDTFAAYRDRIRAAVTRLHEAQPGLRVLLYFDTQRDSTPDAEQRFADSLLRTASGRAERSDFGGRFTPSASLVPTIGNAFGDALPATATALHALGADGLYWDEMDAVEYDAPRVTTSVWDGHTCRLDAGGHVVARLGLANLLSDPLKARLAADGPLLGNSPPTTRRFQRRPDLRMVEGQHNDAWGAFVHLTTPIAYLGSWLDWPRLRAKIDEGVLIAGGSLDRPSAFIARLYPFTPEDLRPGTLRGRERIVTTRSGDVGWRGAAGPLRCFRYDATGAEHPADWPVDRGDGGAFVRVALDVGEAAIIERAPSDPN